MQSWIMAFALVATAVACGDDDGMSTPIDAAVIDAGAADAMTFDASVDASTATQTEGQFCETLDEGGPYCMSDLTCCDDKICRSSCDSGGGITCTSKSDCPGGNVCCDLETMQMCTTKKACADFGGSEVP